MIQIVTIVTMVIIITFCDFYHPPPPLTMVSRFKRPFRVSCRKYNNRSAVCARNRHTLALYVTKRNQSQLCIMVALWYSDEAETFSTIPARVTLQTRMDIRTKAPFGFGPAILYPLRIFYTSPCCRRSCSSSSRDVRTRTARLVRDDVWPQIVSGRAMGTARYREERTHLSVYCTQGSHGGERTFGPEAMARGEIRVALRERPGDGSAMEDLSMDGAAGASASPSSFTPFSRFPFSACLLHETSAHLLCDDSRGFFARGVETASRGQKWGQCAFGHSVQLRSQIFQSNTSKNTLVEGYRSIINRFCIVNR